MPTLLVPQLVGAFLGWLIPRLFVGKSDANQFWVNSETLIRRAWNQMLTYWFQSGPEEAFNKDYTNLLASIIGSQPGYSIGSLQSKTGHVPYRNSKLTMMLKDSLGGDAKMLMIVQYDTTGVLFVFGFFRLNREDLV